MRRLQRAAAMGVLGLLASACAFNSRFYHPVHDGAEIDWGQPEEGFIVGGRKTALHYAYAEPPSGRTRATVFVLHGDRVNLASCGPQVLPFLEHGFAVFVFDYPGYGKSEGRPTHASVLQAADDALTYLLSRQDIDTTTLLVAGFSLGGQIGIVLTAQREREVDALLVEGTFTAHDEIAAYATGEVWGGFARAFVRSPYEAEDAIADLSIPKLIVHSRDDAVVPYGMGLELHERAAEPKSLWSIDGPHMQGFARHEDAYVRRVEALLGLAPHGREQVPNARNAHR